MEARGATGTAVGRVGVSTSFSGSKGMWSEIAFDIGDLGVQRGERKGLDRWWWRRRRRRRRRRRAHSDDNSPHLVILKPIFQHSVQDIGSDLIEVVDPIAIIASPITAGKKAVLFNFNVISTKVRRFRPPKDRNLNFHTPKSCHPVLAILNLFSVLCHTGDLQKPTHPLGCDAVMLQLQWNADDGGFIKMPMISVTV